MTSRTVNKEEMAEVVKKFGGKSTNTGSAEVQVALLTRKISKLNQHFLTHVQDNHSKRGLLKMIGQRRRLLAYIKAGSEQNYAKLIDTLDLRK